MNKRAIIATAISWYNKEDEAFVVQSPLFERVLGVAESEPEAWALFHEFLDDAYVAYLEGKLVGYEKPGRPAKNVVDIHAQVKPEVKKYLVEQAKALGISQGDVIAYLVAVNEVKNEPRSKAEQL